MSLLNKKPLIIGLTGTMGSGKSIVSHIFQVLGISVYNSDTEAKKLYDDPAFRKELHSVFGEKVFDKDGVPDKKEIAQLVFSDKNALQKLNNLIHPKVKEHFFDWCKQFNEGTPYVIQESAILFESGFDSLFDKIIMVYAEIPVVLERIKKRDNLGEQEIMARINNQMSANEKKKRSDYVIINNETQLVVPQILSIHSQLTKV